MIRLKNLLAENMYRFGTKNLNESYFPWLDNDSQQIKTAKGNLNRYYNELAQVPGFDSSYLTSLTNIINNLAKSSSEMEKTNAQTKLKRWFSGEGESIVGYGYHTKLMNFINDYVNLYMNNSNDMDTNNNGYPDQSEKY
jgi:hypothetical protein